MNSPLEPAIDKTPGHVILVVDDNPANQLALAEYLYAYGFRILTADNGEAALEQMVHILPDIILLDVLMPGMDGFETCRRLKMEAAFRDIPVIFMTALANLEDKVKGFKHGAVDYVTKPFQPEEVMARVTTHLRILDLTRKLQETNRDLARQTQVLSRTLEDLKTTQKQLIESEKMAALGGLVAGVAHEINTPVGIGITAASTMVRRTDCLIEARENGRFREKDLDDYLSAAFRGNRMILSNLERAAELVKSFKKVAVDQTNLERRMVPLKEYIRETILSLGPRLKQTRHAITVEGDDTISIDSYPGAIAQVITNLILNSITHGYDEGETGHLGIQIRGENNWAIIDYSDDGRGIPADDLDRIFEPFHTTARGRGGTGLGLHIVYNLVIRKLNGMIRCKSRMAGGTRFIMHLPLQTGEES